MNSTQHLQKPSKSLSQSSGFLQFPGHGHLATLLSFANVIAFTHEVHSEVPSTSCLMGIAELSVFRTESDG
jgi:hypothetical protein